MLSTLILLCVGASTTEIWSTSTLCPLYQNSRGTPAAESVGHIYAARGECESLLLNVRAGRKGLRGLTVSCEPVPDGGGTPEVYAIARLKTQQHSARAMAPEDSWPDVLLSPTPRDLAPEETAGFWILYRIPRDATPGVRQTTITVQSEGGRKRSYPVRIEVFDFELPATPTLQSLTPLDRSAIRRVYSAEDLDINAWRPVYDVLTPYRLGYSIWDGGPLVMLSPDGRPDASAFKEHLAYAAGTGLGVLDISANGRLFQVFAAPIAGSSDDALRAYLEDMYAWLESQGLLNHAVMRIVAPMKREYWPDTVRELEQIQSAGSKIARLLTAPVHPYWQGRAELWAAPFMACGPEVPQALVHGNALNWIPAAQIDASASDSGLRPDGAESRPEDACDGSLVSAWFPEATGRAPEEAWLELHFGQPTLVREMTLIWDTVRARQGLEIETSFDGQIFGKAAVDWTHQDTLGVYTRQISHARLKYEKRLLALRIRFRTPAEAALSCGIAEVVFGPWDDLPERGTIRPMSPWLRTGSLDFPSVAADVHPAEIRLLPWVCRSREMAGFTFEGLNRWNGAWALAEDGAPLGFTNEGAGEGFLFYPAQSGLTPSMRVLRLLDGLEDYEYLAALRTAVRDGKIAEEEARRIAPPLQLGPTPTFEELEGLSQLMERAHLEMGRALEGKKARGNRGVVSGGIPQRDAPR